jgi:hypothetical protein
MKRSSNSPSPLYQVIAKGIYQPFDVPTFNASYSNSRFFRIYMLFSAAATRDAIKAAYNQVKMIT